jgi:hypothetical protein
MGDSQSACVVVGVGVAPTALVDRLQAQVRQRPESLGAQQRVAQLEQRIGAAAEAAMQLVPERAEPREGKVGIGMTAQPDSHVGHQQLDQCNASPG